MKKEIKVGIYKITSPTGKIYIGKSKDIEKRWEKDYKKLQCIRQPKLYRSFIKHGVANHIFEILEECNDIYLDELEIWWKYYYDIKCVENGLCYSYIDKTLWKDKKQTNEQIYKIRKSKWRAIIQYSLEGHFIKEWQSIKEASTSLHIFISHINKYKPSGGFIWKYKTENYPLKIERYIKPQFVPVIQYSLEGNFIREWESQKEPINIYNLSIGDITCCCKGKQKSAGGFQWMYKTDNYSLKIEPILPSKKLGKIYKNKI